MTVTYVAAGQNVVQPQGAEKPCKKEEKKDVSFWSSDWTAGNFIRKTTGWDGLADWLDDKDKVCTDGKDDGKLGFGETMESFGKGLAGLAKQAMNHPIATAAAVGAGAIAVVATGGAILPVMVAAGAVAGTGMAGYGAYKAATAETDAEAKQAWETIGNGAFAVTTSALGAKASLNAAANAGVTSAKGAGDMNAVEATLAAVKATPEALKVSAMNAKGNALTMATGTVHAHSNQLQGAHEYMSKANDVQAYRFNPNGTPDEILANNPGVYRGEDGKYYLPNKWNASEPYAIDTSKEQMIMMYGGDDMAVCDGAIFKGSYVDTASFNNGKGALNYQDPAKLEYGKVVDVTKQAPGAFKVMPEGTKIQTLEGPRTVQAGEVVALDHAGNPYATTAQNIAKRNTGFSVEGQAELLDQQGVKLKEVYYDFFYANRTHQDEIVINMNGKTYTAIVPDGLPCSRRDFFYPTSKDYQSDAQEWLLNNLNKANFLEGVWGEGIPKFGPRAR